MKKSTRALVGMIVIDLLLLAGAAWLVMQTREPSALTVPRAEAVETITTIFGGAIGLVTVILLLAFFRHRRSGN